MTDQRPQRALVIDDNTVVRRVLQDLVTSFGYRADVAADGPEAIALFEQNGYDVVLTDLAMPRMSGWQVLAAVRERDPKTPVIIVTGSHVYADDQRIAQPGVTVVPKPVEMHALREALSRVLRGGSLPGCPG